MVAPNFYRLIGINNLYKRSRRYASLHNSIEFLSNSRMTSRSGSPIVVNPFLTKNIFYGKIDYSIFGFFRQLFLSA